MIRNDRQYFLPQNIERFRERYPDIELNITQQLSKDIESGILNGRLDIGFVSEPSIPGSVDYRTLGKNYTLLAAPAAMGLAAEGAEKEPLPFRGSIYISLTARPLYCRMRAAVSGVTSTTFLSMRTFSQRSR